MRLIRVLPLVTTALIATVALMGCQQSPPPAKPRPPRILRAEGSAKNRNPQLARDVAFHRALAKVAEELHGVQVTEETRGDERVVCTSTEGTVEGAQIERQWTDEDGTVHVQIRVEVPQR